MKNQRIVVIRVTAQEEDNSDFTTRAVRTYGERSKVLRLEDVSGFDANALLAEVAADFFDLEDGKATA